MRCTYCAKQANQAIFPNKYSVGIPVCRDHAYVVTGHTFNFLVGSIALAIFLAGLFAIFLMFFK